MRLKHLYIGKYRVLENLSINFERGNADTPETQRKYHLDFLVGVNGTGKSTVLRVIGMLFARLLGQEVPRLEIPVRLTYVLAEGTDREKTVTVTNQPTDSEADEVFEPSDWQLKYKEAGEDSWHLGERVPHVPEYVVIYTTGAESSWHSVLNESLDRSKSPLEISTITNEAEEWEKYIRELPGHAFRPQSVEEAEQSDPKLLFITEKHLPLVTLCGLLAAQLYYEIGSTVDDGGEPINILGGVLRSIGLDRLIGFSLRIRLADQASESQKETINKLRAVTSRIIQQGADALFVFDTLRLHQDGVEPEQTLGTLYPTIIELFQKLFTLYLHAPSQEVPLQQVNLFLSTKVEGEQRDLISFEWLSDGEQSFLARMALFALFRAQNLLILLDEPEVHFNDVWKREIVSHLDTIMNGCTSHALITTHSSIAITDVKREDMLVLERDGKSTKQVREIDIKTLGADPSDILVHVFGARSASGERGISYIGRRLADGNQDLEELKKIVAPGYWRYRIQLEQHRRDNQQPSSS